MFRGFLSTYTLHIAVAAVVVAAAASAGTAWKVRDWQCKAAEAATLQRAAAETKRMQEDINEQSALYEEARAAAGVVSVQRTQTIREIYRDAPPVSADCSAPAGVGSVLLDAVEDANSAVSGTPREPSPTVPST